jgi:hypothetical protein
MTGNEIHVQSFIQGQTHILLSSDIDADQWLPLCQNIRSLFQSAELLTHGKDKVAKLNLELEGKSTVVAIKRFGRQSFIKDWYDQRHKSKAVRSLEAAVYLLNHQINTPQPLAVIDYWQNGRLIDSYYLSQFENAISFRDALLSVYHDTCDSSKLMELLYRVAPAVKKMHDAGFQHGDMGNQNILLPKSADGGWAEPCFIDLNRYSINTSGLNAQARAFDLSRPILPGNYLKFFLQIYSGNQEPESELNRWQDKYRRQFTRHRQTRKLRHPFRYFLKKRQPPDHRAYPDDKDYWLWDEKTSQPMIALSKQEKNRQRNFADMFRIAFRCLQNASGIWKNYRQLRAQSFLRPCELKGRIGLSLHPHQEYISTEISLLNKLGKPPVWIRFYCHEQEADWQKTIDYIETLVSQQFDVSVALIQDRQAVLQPGIWRLFLDYIIPRIANRVSQIEVTHAFNRVKWGIWNQTEWQDLMAAVWEYQQRYPELKFLGPACIDFEYAPVISALSDLSTHFPNWRLSGLSHLLYVDRRGAPENKQGSFSTLEKVVLLKAINQHMLACNDKLVISEVNWPIENTHIWSPIVCPYETAYWQTRASGENEEKYAHFMLRYLMITICSGHVDQVFWWRLSAHGYGLIDDQNNFRERPAFVALQFLLSLLGEARFEKKWETPTDEWILEFSRNNQRYLMVWTSGENKIPFNHPFTQAWDYLGNSIKYVELTGAPIYVSIFESKTSDQR